MASLWTPNGEHEVTTPSEQLSAFQYTGVGRRAERLAAAGIVEDTDAIDEMRKNRAVNARLTKRASGDGYGFGSHISMATGRPKDPIFYWKENNLPWDLALQEDLEKLRSFMRLLYVSHPVIASAIDIMSRYPIIGVELQCKDDEITEFYTSLFFDQLDYEEFLIDVGREYWLVGEAFPIGSFNETLGVWEADELLDPNDIKVIRSPFLKEPRFEMRVPEVMRNILTTRQPAWEYEALIAAYPELSKFTREDDYMPVSNILMKHLRFKGDTFHPRGLPILMRGYRAIIQEEMLNAAQDAIAERLYTPLVIAKLGASGSDLGTDSPWIPTEDQKLEFEMALDAALAGDFRVLITHFATQMETVFGKESMPDFTDDYDRLTDRQLQVFGMSRTMLNGADGGQTYAADALNRDLITQLLGTHQRKLDRLWTDRMKVVAEAQGHYDYEERNGIKYPIMEEVLEVDPETGEQTVTEQPKLLVPTVKWKSMSMADEEANQQFMEALRASEVPISIKTRLINVPVDLEEEIEISKDEQIAIAVAAQEVRRDTYTALLKLNLPIPDDLMKDFGPSAEIMPAAAPPQPGMPADGSQILPNVATADASPTEALVPSPDDMGAQAAGDESPADQAPSGPPSDSDAAPGGPVIPLPKNKAPSRPPESDEQRKKMPKKSSLESKALGSLIDGPSTVGSRKYANIDRMRPLDEQI